MAFEVGDVRTDPESPQAVCLQPGAGRRVWAFSGDRYTLKSGAASSNGSLGLMEAEIPPGSGPPLHYHRFEDEAFYVLDGRLEIVADGRTMIAEAGAFVYLPRGTVHRFENVGDDVARMLLLFLPGGFEEFFLEVGTPVGDEGRAPTADTFDEHVITAMTIAEERFGIVPA